MKFSSTFLACLAILGVRGWIVTSYYKTSITTIPNPFFPGGTESEASTVTIPVFPTAAVSTISVSSITDNGVDAVPYLTVVEVLVPGDAPATTTTTAPFACDSNSVNTCTNSPTTADQTEYIAYITITAPSYCSSTFSYVATTRLDEVYVVPSEVTSPVYASATYKTIDVSSYVSQCIDPRVVTDFPGLAQSTLTCTPGPDGPTQGCPTPNPPPTAAASSTPGLIDTSALFSAIGSAEASATGGGKKNDAAHIVGGEHWALLATSLILPFLWVLTCFEAHGSKYEQ